MKNSKTINLNSYEFRNMSPAHIDYLRSEGYHIVITDNSYTMEDTKPVAKATTTVSYNKATSKAEKPVKANKNAKTSAKSTASSKAKKPTANKNKELAFGKNIKVGNYVKCLNLKDHKLVCFGKVAAIKDGDNVGKIVELTNTRKFAIENCIAISEKEFKTLSKTHKGIAKQNAKKQSTTSTKLTARDYKLCYAKYLLTLGKITESDFNQVKADDKALSELYHLYTESDEPVKLSNADAMKIFADNAKINA